MMLSVYSPPPSPCHTQRDAHTHFTPGVTPGVTPNTSFHAERHANTPFHAERHENTPFTPRRHAIRLGRELA
eukprot:scaffold5974_cov92-Skeletonema_marinoi.AAC.4